MGSQLSDIYSSSVYEGGSLERFPYPIPDDLFMLDPPSIKTTFSTGGSRQSKAASRVNVDDSENVKKLHWDGTGNTSDIWTRFKQIAYYTSGLPKVMCERCGKVLEYPNWSSNGTHSLRRHWEGPKCQKSGAKANKQPYIRQLIKDSSLLRIAQSAPFPLKFPSAKTVQRRIPVTTDNVSNNNTLITSIQESIQALELDKQITIIRILYIAHVIQLSLNKLLSRIKANPKNQVVEREWSESRSQALRSSQRNKEIANTLEKIRGLAVFINRSPQRRDAFLSLQIEEPKLVPIQDIERSGVKSTTFFTLRNLSSSLRLLFPRRKTLQSIASLGSIASYLTILKSQLASLNQSKSPGND
ncbi:hypothetical protein N7534_007870 [Penicillium rubens]|nr:hypothetical protein N7534_007870 [Penicillium rubens]